MARITPTVEQQRVLDRIELQRERLRARRVARAQARALAEQAGGPTGGADASLALRAAGFAREHPLAVAAMPAGAGAAGAGDGLAPVAGRPSVSLMLESPGDGKDVHRCGARCAAPLAASYNRRSPATDRVHAALWPAVQLVDSAESGD